MMMNCSAGYIIIDIINTMTTRNNNIIGSARIINNN